MPIFPVFLTLVLKLEHQTGILKKGKVWQEKAVTYGCQLIQVNIFVPYGWDLQKKVLIKEKRQVLIRPILVRLCKLY